MDSRSEYFSRKDTSFAQKPTQTSDRSSFLGQTEFKANKDHHSPPEGVVVAEENDYPVISAPEGSLQFHHKVRELKHGYKIILKQPIKLAYTPTIHSGYANRKKQTFLLECVQEMLQKNVIILVKMSVSLGFLQQIVSSTKTKEKVEANN